MKLPIKLKPTQKTFLKALKSKKYLFYLYAGTAGTGKSFTTALFNCFLAAEYDDCRIGVFRKHLTTARKTVYHTYIKVLNMLEIDYRAVGGSDPRIDIGNSRVEFFEMDISKDPDWNKIKGLELTCGHIEEINEIDQGGFSILMTRIGRWNTNGVPPYIVGTCNPSQGWIRDVWRDPAVDGTLKLPYYFLESGPEELEDDYRAILENLPPEEYSRYVKNNWDYSEDPNQLVRFEWVKNSFVSGITGNYTHAGIDVARTGKDHSIFYPRAVYCFGTPTELDTNDTMKVAEWSKSKSESLGIPGSAINIDTIGVGGGVADRMRELDCRANDFNSSASPLEKIDWFGMNKEQESYLKFRNLRAQMYWKLRVGFQENKLTMVNHAEAVKQLTSIRYLTKEKYIQIEGKDDIKKRLGYSPDYADAMMISMFVPEEEPDFGLEVFNSTGRKGQSANLSAKDEDDDLGIVFV